MAQKKYKFFNAKQRDLFNNSHKDRIIPIGENEYIILTRHSTKARKVNKHALWKLSNNTMTRLILSTSYEPFICLKYGYLYRDTYYSPRSRWNYYRYDDSIEPIEISENMISLYEFGFAPYNLFAFRNLRPVRSLKKDNSLKLIAVKKENVLEFFEETENGFEIIDGATIPMESYYGRVGCDKAKELIESGRVQTMEIDYITDLHN